MPPRRTRAMGFSPGGAQALDINAPSRKRKNLAQQNTSESHDDHPAKRTRAQSSVQDASNDENESVPSSMSPEGTQTRRTRRKGTQTLDVSKESQDMTSSTKSSAKIRQTRRTRKHANTTDAESSKEGDDAIRGKSSTTVEERSKKRSQAHITRESPSEEAFQSTEATTFAEADSRPLKRTRVLDHTSPRKITLTSTLTSVTQVAERQNSPSAAIKEPSDDESQLQRVHQQSLASKSTPKDMAGAIITIPSDQEQKSSDADPELRSEVGQKGHDDLVSYSNSASETSENAVDNERDSAEYADALSEDDVDTPPADDESIPKSTVQRRPDSTPPKHEPPLSDFGIFRDDLSRSNNSQVEASSTHFVSPIQTAKSTSEFGLLSLSTAKVNEIALKKSGTYRQIRRKYQTNELDEPVFDNMTEEEVDQLALIPQTQDYRRKRNLLSIAKSGSRTYSQRDVNKISQLGGKYHQTKQSENAASTGLDTHSLNTARYFEWKDDSGAMFVVKELEPHAAAAVGDRSNREEIFTSTLPHNLHYLLAPNLRTIALTNPRAIAAMTTFAQRCVDDPNDIPTSAEVSSLFDDIAKSRQSQPLVSSMPLFADSHIRTAKPSPFTPQSSRRSATLQSTDARSSITPKSRNPSEDSIMSFRMSVSEEMTSTNASGTGLTVPHTPSHEPEPSQPEDHGGWASALSASRIGALIKTPLRYFSRGPRSQQNVPATAVRQIVSQAPQANITRSERPQRVFRPVNTSNNRNSSHTRVRRTSPVLGTALPHTPTPVAKQAPKSLRRPNSHLPTKKRHTPPNTLTPHSQKGSIHRKKVSPQPDSEDDRPAPIDHALVARNRAKHLERIRTPGYMPGDPPRNQESHVSSIATYQSVTSVSEDLGRDQPGSKRKRKERRVTWAESDEIMVERHSDVIPEQQGTRTFTVPFDDDSDEEQHPTRTFTVPYDDDSDEELAPEWSSSDRNRSRSHASSMSGGFSPEEESPPPAKIPRIDSSPRSHKAQKIKKYNNWFLDYTTEEHFAEHFTPPRQIPANFIITDEPGRNTLLDVNAPSEPLQEDAEHTDITVFEPPNALSEISQNRNHDPTPAKAQSNCVKQPVDSSTWQKHKPKVSSGLRHSTIASPIAEVVTLQATTSKSDYGPFVTDPNVVEDVNALPEKLAASPKASITGNDYGPFVTNLDVRVDVSALPEEIFAMYRFPNSVYQEVGFKDRLESA